MEKKNHQILTVALEVALCVRVLNSKTEIINLCYTMLSRMLLKCRLIKTEEKMKLSIKDFLMENFIFCAVKFCS